ncbi:succinate dehydrogenase cytochrome b subunit [Mucilaginibacter paludis]|uniref:Succinate dehydrogenase (Or fumarate reductase) cytochrome b subunit, b558 family n=1 Tax=Mucilaginibacter paludis DSM 18603 TaxID=714943 RepID=H1Y918_9SPHI|nr:succinate dehydrogenase cytochrome b subunit [Mucilaginibacter paludis]EHQ29056.1 succinate dehydrogenase (or fumarate reductase) cytochrome b subunit, b558 family [Mucilaginibacter paludis DSM 18603]
MKTTTLKYKLVMSLTGLFLCFFLIIHLLGNLQLLLPAAQAKLQFNWYSNLLAGNMLIKIISWVLLASIIAHAVYALLITRHNTKANGTKYVYDKRDAASKWNSRNMGLLGTIILLFLVIHFKDFWYQYDFKELPLDSASNKDMYTVVVETFRQWWYVLIYEAAFIALGFHLLHGFFSAARTLGLYHPKYAKWVNVLGWVYTAFITLGFMFIPLYIYFK